MKEKPQDLKYFSYFSLQISILAAAQIYFTWALHNRLPLSLYLWAFLMLGLVGAWNAWHASRNLVSINFLCWLNIVFTLLRADETLPLTDYQFFSFVLFSVLITVQSVWLYTGVIKIVNRPGSHWWKTPRRVSADIKAIVKTEYRSFMGHIKNFSHEGLLIKVNDQEDEFKFKVGENIKIHLMLKKYEYVQFLAEVVRHHAPLPDEGKKSAAYGLKIVKIDEKSKERIEQFVGF